MNASLNVVQDRFMAGKSEFKKRLSEIAYTRDRCQRLVNWLPQRNIPSDDITGRPPQVANEGDG